jgi:hypothetical protein
VVDSREDRTGFPLAGEVGALVSGCTGRLFATGDELLAGLIICLSFRKNGRIVQRDGRDGNDGLLLGNWNFNSDHRFRPLVRLSIVHRMKTDATKLVAAGRQSQQAMDQGLRKIVGLNAVDALKVKGRCLAC